MADANQKSRAAMNTAPNIVAREMVFILGWNICGISLGGRIDRVRRGEAATTHLLGRNIMLTDSTLCLVAVERI